MTDFWRLIGAHPLETADDVRDSLEQISTRLDALDPPDLELFVEELQEHLYRIDRRDLAEIPVVLADGRQFPQTADHFLYARCACILAGEEEYRRSERSSSGFARFVKPSVQSAEGLLYLAPSIYEKKVGRQMDVASRFSVESMSNREGWER
jgi:hypothetical protein